MTIHEKIAAWPLKPEPLLGEEGPEDAWISYYAARLDLALEVLRHIKDTCVNCDGNGVYLDEDELWNDCRYCQDARAVLAACGEGK